jgi:hypothetical protein
MKSTRCADWIAALQGERFRRSEVPPQAHASKPIIIQWHHLRSDLVGQQQQC